MSDAPEGSIWIGDSRLGLAITPRGVSEEIYHQVDVRFFAGAFRGAIHTYFLGGFDRTCEQIDDLYSKLKGSVAFPSADYGLDVVMKASALGHVTVDISAPDSTGSGALLKYTIPLDQSYLPTISRELRAAFPSDATAH